MTRSACATRCVRIPEPAIRRSNGDDPPSRQQTPGSSDGRPSLQLAAHKALAYLRETKDDINPRLTLFLCNAIGKLSDRQLRELRRTVQADVRYPQSQSEHRGGAYGNAAAGESLNEPDVAVLIAGLRKLGGDQLDWLSTVIASELERYLQPDHFAHPLRTGAYAHRLVDRRRKARRRRQRRLRGEGPYEAVMNNAMSLFGCSSSTLAQAYADFKWMRRARMVDDAGNFVP